MLPIIFYAGRGGMLPIILCAEEEGRTVPVIFYAGKGGGCYLLYFVLREEGDATCCILC